MADLLPDIDVLLGNEDAFDEMLGISLPNAGSTAHDSTRRRVVTAVRTAG